MGQALLSPGLRERGMTVRGHRDHRRDRDAAQSLSALGTGSIAKAAIRRGVDSQGDSSSTRSIRSWRSRSRFSSTPRFWFWRQWYSSGETRMPMVAGDRHRAGRLDSDRLPDVVSAARHRGGQHAVRRRAAGQRSKQHDHRHACRPGGNGRVHALADSPLAAATDHAIAGDQRRPCWLLRCVREAKVTDLLNLSQLFLGLQLPLAMFPLMHFTSSRKYMGKHRNGWFLFTAGWGSCILITALDIYGLPDSIRDAWRVLSGNWIVRRIVGQKINLCIAKSSSLSTPRPPIRRFSITSGRWPD